MKRVVITAMTAAWLIGVAGLATSGWAQVAGEPVKQADTAAPAGQDELERVVGELKGALKDAALVRVLGFYSTRMALLDRIAKEIPSLADQAKAAHAAMERELGPGAQQIELALLGRGTDKAAELEALKATAKAEAGKQKLDEVDLKRAFDTGGYAPQGQSPRNVMLLLATSPENVQKPEHVYDAGFATTLPLVGGAAAGGDQIGSMKVPTTFALVSGEKPGDRLTFAYGGYAPATITVTVDPAAPGLTPEKAIENVVSGNAATLKAKTDKAKVIDTPNGRAAILPIDMTVESGGKRSLGRGEMYLLPVGDKLVGVAMTVQAPEGPDQETKADELWKRFEGLFQRVRGGITLKK